MSEITFDPVAHEYTVDGVWFPGITQVLKDVGLIDVSYYTPEAAARGTAVHEAVQLIVKGLVDAEAFGGSEIEPYILAWARFAADSKIEVLASERLCADTTTHFATHVDLEAKLNGREVVIDFKTGSLQGWHGVQLAANTVLTGKKDRYVLQLSADGKYKLHAEWKGESFASRVWDKTWLSAITIFWWKRQYGK